MLVSYMQAPKLDEDNLVKKYSHVWFLFDKVVEEFDDWQDVSTTAKDDSVIQENLIQMESDMKHLEEEARELQPALALPE